MTIGPFVRRSLGRH